MAFLGPVGRDLAPRGLIGGIAVDPSKGGKVGVIADSVGGWASRFEVHVDQVIGLAERTEPIERSA